MTSQRDRDEFIATMTQEGLPVSVTRTIMRHGATLHRLAEAQCNGDWPADNGKRQVVPCGGAADQGCGMYWHPSTLKGPMKQCPDCRIGLRVTALLAPYNITPIFNGDPRGAVLKLKVPSGRTNDWGREGVCVP